MAMRHAGYEAIKIDNGRAAIDAVGHFQPDIVILDVMLPDLDGIEVCGEIRASGSDVPILFLSARDGTEDTIQGLSAGGDDYLTKPFAVAELLARVRAILRRTADLRRHTKSRLSCGDVEIDTQTREVRRGGTLVGLTSTEFDLFRYLMVNIGRVLTKGELLEAVWSYDFGGNPNLLETYVSYLRRKLDPLGPPLIHTVRGVGYMLRLPEKTL